MTEAVTKGAAPTCPPSPAYASVIEGRYGWLLRLFFKLLFSRVRPVPEQVRRVRALAKEGTLVYVLRSRSDLESLLYHYQSLLHGLPAPVFACDSNMTLSHSLGFIIRRVRQRFLGRPQLRGPDPYSSGFIKDLIRCGQPVILSLQDMEAFAKRFLRFRHDPFVQVLEVQREQDRPIFMIPQMIIWDRAQERLRPRLDEVLFGQRSHPSGLRVLFNFLRFYRKDSYISQAEPLSVRDFLRGYEDEGMQEAAVRLRQELLDRFQLERRLATGPVAPSRQEIMQRVLFHDRVQHAIERRVKRKGKSPKAVRKEAYRIIREIAADFDPTFLRLWDWVMNWALRNLFDGLEVDRKGLERIRAVARRSNLVLIPCHRSHMDYMILAYIFYHNYLFPPLIAAGLNLAFWPMGYLFRKSGAFFIRRDLRGSVLYPVILTQYIRVLLEDGYPLEFFIEGGRSRSGKMTLPKFGFLSLLIDGYRSGVCRDLAFVPVAISYDRVMEESAYLREVEGNEKPKESFWEIVRSRNVIRKRYGRVYVTFHEPISLRSFLARSQGNPSTAVNYSRKDIPHYLAYQIVQKINQVMVVVPTALTAAAILSSSLRGFTYLQVLRFAEILYGVLEEMDAPFSSSLQDRSQVPRAVRETLEFLTRERLIHRTQIQQADGEDEDDDLLFELQDRSRRRLNYYKNTILHYLLVHAFVSLSLLAAGNHAVSRERILGDVAFLREFLRQEFVFLPDEDLEARIQRTLDHLVEGSQIRRVHGGFAIASGHRQDLLGFARLIQSYLESYFVVASSLKHIAKRRLSRMRFVWRVRFNAHRLYQTGRIQLPESLSQVNFTNAIQYLVDQKIILREVDKTFREGTYYRLNRERRKIHWRRIKNFLESYR